MPPALPGDCYSELYFASVSQNIMLRRIIRRIMKNALAAMVGYIYVYHTSFWSPTPQTGSEADWVTLK
jgi:hypothetical protein